MLAKPTPNASATALEANRKFMQSPCRYSSRALAAQLIRIEIVDARHLEHAPVERAHGFGFGRRQYTFLLGLVDLARNIVGLDVAGAPRVEDPPLERLDLLGNLHRLLQKPELIAGLDGRVDAGREALARRRRIDHELDDLLAQRIGRGRVRAAAREDEEAEQRGNPAVREVAQQAVELLLSLVEQRAARPLDERQILGRLTLVLI